MKIKKFIALLLVSFMVFASGCWDKIEINDRAFVYSMAVDSSGSSTNEKGGEAGGGTSKINAIFTVPVVSKIAGGSQGGGGGGGEGKAYVNLEGKGDNIPSAIRDVGKRMNRSLFFGQTKLFLVGKGLLNDESSFRETIDLLERKPEMSRELQVAMVNGKISDITNVTPKVDKLLATYVEGIFKNGSKINNIVSTDLNQFLSSLRNDNKAVIPCISIKGNAVEVKDMALIKDYKLLDIADNKYTRGYLMITNNLKSGRKSFQYEGKDIPFIISSSNSKVKLTDSQKLKYNVLVTIEGDIEDYYFGEQLDKNKIADIQKALGDSIKRELNDTTKYFQQDVACDFLKFGDYTKKYHYDVYKKYEKNWDNAFKNAEINYDVKVYVRRIGTAR